MKKLLMFALMLAMLASLLCVPAQAAESVWDGKLPTDLSAATLAGKGTKESPYIIASAADLANFALQVNNAVSFYQKYVRLVCDIDLANKPWTPIGGSELAGCYFDGEFDGNHHVIKNLKVESDKAQVGFFGMIGGAVIRNLGIESGTVSGADYSGGLVGEAFDNAEIINCYNNADVNAVSQTTNVTAGGILGGAVDKKLLTISDCVNNGDITAEASADTYARAGGIVGLSLGAGAIKELLNCYNTGEITLVNAKDNLNTRIGGIAGGFMNDATVEKCVSTGSVKVLMSAYEASRIGTLIGSFSSHKDGTVNKGAFTDCKYIAVEGFGAAGYPAVEHISGAEAVTEFKIPRQNAEFGFVMYQAPDDSIP